LVKASVKVLVAILVKVLVAIFGNQSFGCPLRGRICSPTSPEAQQPTQQHQSQFIRDVNFPDGAVVPAEQALVKEWEAANCGKGAWPAEVKLIFTRGDRELLGEVEEFPVAAAAPGTSVILSALIKTPARPGKYTAYFALADADRRPFGARFWVDLVVEKKLETKEKFEVKSPVAVEQQNPTEQPKEKPVDQSNVDSQVSHSEVSQSLNQVSQSPKSMKEPGAHSASDDEDLDSETEAQFGDAKKASKQTEPLKAATPEPAKTSEPIKATTEPLKPVAPEPVKVEPVKAVEPPKSQPPLEPSKPENKQTQEAAVVTALKAKYAKELAQLSTMGFEVDAQVISLLEAKKGNVHEVIMQLIEKN